MKQTLIEQIALAYKKDKGKNRDHICASTNQLGAKCGKVMQCAQTYKYDCDIQTRVAFKSILKRKTMDLIISSIKFYESL